MGRRRRGASACRLDRCRGAAAHHAAAVRTCHRGGDVRHPGRHGRRDAAPRWGTECNYTPASGISPTVKLTVDWGDGQIAMASAGVMGRQEPGLTSPYDGIGDQAVAVGPALMIRTGDDLVSIVFSGVSGAPAKARRIFDTAKARM